MSKVVIVESVKITKSNEPLSCWRALISKTITEVESQRQSTQLVGKHSNRVNLVKIMLQITISCTAQRKRQRNTNDKPTNSWKITSCNCKKKSQLNTNDKNDKIRVRPKPSRHMVRIGAGPIKRLEVSRRQIDSLVLESALINRSPTALWPAVRPWILGSGASRTPAGSINSCLLVWTFSEGPSNRDDVAPGGRHTLMIVFMFVWCSSRKGNGIS